MSELQALESASEYRIAWMTALDIELAAATALLDECHEQPLDFIPGDTDDNVYTWGRVSGHNVVIVSLPDGEYGLTNATTTSERLLSSLPHIKIGLLVGIGAGLVDSGLDIRLGDVAVSRPEGTTGGVVQYDSFKARKDGRERIGVLNQPPRVLLNALRKLKAKHELEDSKIPYLLQQAMKNHPKFAQAYAHPGFERDRLFREADSGIEEEVQRIARSTSDPAIHYGTIISGNVLVKDAKTRTEIIKSVGQSCICLEMEAAGLMNSFPCIVIRGICDYADAHKNDDWQRYASATAAAFAKELLSYVPKSEMERTKNINQVLEGMQATLNSMNENHIQAGQRELDDRVSKFLRRLYTHSYTEAKDRNPRRISGTCEWFMNHPLFNQWREGQATNTLWVSADPGCGKSVLARYLIDGVLSKQNRSICYFFFKDDFAEQRTGCSAVRTLIHQLLSADWRAIPKSTMDSILSKIEAYGPKFIESFTDLWSVFLKLSKHLKKDLFCVFDALDECQDGDRSLLIRAICESEPHFTQTNDFKLKILVLSRPYFNIQHDFDHWRIQIPILHLSGEDDKERELISKEIDLVIRHRIRVFCDRRQLNEKDHDFLLATIISVPQKTYLWAHLTMALIEETIGFTRGGIRLICQELPATVNAAYERILERSIDKRKTRLLLEMILVARRPLSMHETCLLLALDGSQTRSEELEEFIEPEERFKQTVRNLCGFFIIVVDRRVYLLHQTAREFLLKRASKASGLTSLVISGPRKLVGQGQAIAWAGTFSLSKSNRSMTERCVLFIGLGTDVVLSAILYDYCAVFWTVHFLASAESSQDEFLDLIYRCCLSSSERCREWFDRSLPSMSVTLPAKCFIRRDLIVNSNTLAIVCYFGLTPFVKLHFRGKWEQEWTQHTLSKALCNALYSDCIETVKLLIDHGADPKIACCPMELSTHASLGQLQRPLWFAIIYNKPEIIELFLQYDAKFHIVDQRLYPSYDTLLHRTLEKRTDYSLLSPERSLQGSPVPWLQTNMIPSESWQKPKSENIIPMLLKYNVDPRAVNIRGEDALLCFYSCPRKHGKDCDALRQLLRADADVNQETANGRTAISLAVEAGCLDCVKDLLQRKASLHIQDMFGRTPLHYVNEILPCFENSVRGPIVAELLRAGASLYTRDNAGRRAFLSIISGVVCNIDIFQMLIATGTDVNGKLEDGFTLLHHVTNVGQLNLLAAHGANINGRGIDGTTPLMYRIRNDLFEHHSDQLELITAMIRYGADLSIQNDEGYLALMVYFEHANHPSFGIPCETLWSGNQGDLMLTNIHGETSLHLLAKQSEWYCATCMEFLIDHGLSIDATDAKGQTPLFLAVSSYNEQMINNLLLLNADVNIANRNGKTALSIACKKGLIEAIELLLEHGADILDPDNLDLEFVHLFPSLDWLKRLITKVADINEQDMDGQTLLIRICERMATNTPEWISFMLAHGADPSIEDYTGRTALKYAKQRHSYDSHENAHDEWRKEEIRTVIRLLEEAELAELKDEADGQDDICENAASLVNQDTMLIDLEHSICETHHQEDLPAISTSESRHCVPSASEL